MTTALKRTPRIGEKWHFRHAGKVISGKVAIVRLTGLYKMTVTLRRTNADPRGEFKIPGSECFSSAATAKTKYGA